MVSKRKRIIGKKLCIFAWTFTLTMNYQEKKVKALVWKNILNLIYLFDYCCYIIVLVHFVFIAEVLFDLN